jgi:uracil-DNA glycosylase
MSQLTQLYDQIKVCQKCDLAKGRNNTVPGEGPEQAEIMLIGEAPGFHEDRQGRPFVGAAGNLLDELLAGINLKRDQIYICNVLKCRPPQNRDPQPDEMEACKAYLDQQIALINPKVIITISRFAMTRWFVDKKISEIHGKPRKIGDLVILPMYHPAAALHQPSLRSVLADDFKKIPGILKEMANLKEEAVEDASRKDKPPEQLSMF